MKRWGLLLLLFWVPAFASPEAAGEKLDLETFRKIVIQHNGRYKPVETFAYEIVREITGDEYFQGTGADGKPVFENPAPAAAFADLLFRPEKYYHQPLIWVFHSELRRDLGLPAGRTHFSYKEVEAVEEKLQKMVEPLQGKGRLLAKESAIRQTSNRWSLTRAMLTRSDQFLRWIPLYFVQDEALRWFSLKDAERWLTTPSARASETTAKMVRDLMESFRGMERSYQKGDVAAFNRKVRELDHDQKMLGFHMRQHQAQDPNLTDDQKEVLVFPDTGDIEYEYAYHQLKPFKKAWLFYLASLVVFILTWGIRRGFWGWILPLIPFAAGLGFHLYGLFMRSTYTGHAPWSTMYEAMTLMAFGIVVISIALSVYLKTRLFVMSASGVGMLVLILADVGEKMGISSTVQPLMPALQTFWLTIHTPCIMLGFGAGMVLAAIAHVYLFVYLFGPGQTKAQEFLNECLYRVLQVAVIFLTAGTCLGAVWAGDAWGRYWGWDMKEIWALATLLTYVAILHGRVAGYLSGFGVSLSALAAFGIVFLTFYGVNVLFGQGLHSYGRGIGSMAPLIIFFVFEAALAAASVFVYHSRTSGSSGEMVQQS